MSTKYLKTAAAVVAMIAVAAAARDFDPKTVEQSFELKDGSVVYIFKNGKMGMENKSGQTMRMKPGVVMETKDGRKIMMHGDEVMAVESLKRKDMTR